MSALIGALDDDIIFVATLVTFELSADGEYRFWEGKDGWHGIVHEGNTYYWVDNHRNYHRLRKLRVDEQVVRNARE